MRTEAQWKQIFYALRDGAKLTPADAMALCGSDRLAARIIDIKQAMERGEIPYAEIHAPLIDVGGARVCQYYIGKAPKATGKQFRQHTTMCSCGKSWWSVDGKCNRCQVER